MLDTIALQKNSIPTVTLSFDTFELMAKMLAKMHKFPDVPIVVIQHFEGRQNIEMARKEVDTLADTIFGNLLKPR